jgi:hypothetical protein
LGGHAFFCVSSPFYALDRIFPGYLRLRIRYTVHAVSKREIFACTIAPFWDAKPPFLEAKALLSPAETGEAFMTRARKERYALTFNPVSSIPFEV